MRQFLAPKTKRWWHKGPKQKASLDRKWLRFRRYMLSKYGYRCMKCGTTKGTMQVDHIKPKSVYRSLWYREDNAQILCRPCNMKKGTATVDYRPTTRMQNYDYIVTKNLTGEKGK